MKNRSTQNSSISPKKPKHFLIASAFFAGALIHSASTAGTLDGFFMYCTSNLDGTGSCTNEEDNRPFSCLIVPGQIISCPSESTTAVECVWISGITANQAQFWCDPEDEAKMYGAKPQQTQQEAPDNTKPKNAAESITPNEQEIKDDLFQNVF
jgi:hypothetical protein